MRILIVGEVFSRNLGDGVICETTYKLLQKKYPEAQIDLFDLSFRDGYMTYKADAIGTKALEKVTMKQRLAGVVYRTEVGVLYFNNRELMCRKSQLEKLEKSEYDICVFAGGSIFMDYFALMIYKIIRLMNKKGIPVVFNGCGLGVNDNSLFRWLIRISLRRNNVKYISLRDGVDEFKKRYKYTNCVKTSDIAINCADVFGIHKEGSRIVGLGIMAIKDKEEQLTEFWKRISLHLEEKGIPFEVFTNGDINDNAYANYLVESGVFKREQLLHPPSIPYDLVQQLSRFCGIISFRLHSHIIATALEIPSVAVVWNPKVREFFGQIGQPENCFEISADVVSMCEKLEVTAIDDGLLVEMKERAVGTLFHAVNVGLNA